MMLNEELKLKLVKRLCRVKDINPTDEVVHLLMSFPYRVIAKPLIQIDAQAGKFTYQQLADNYCLSKRQIEYIVQCQVYD